MQVDRAQQIIDAAQRDAERRVPSASNTGTYGLVTKVAQLTSECGSLAAHIRVLCAEIADLTALLDHVLSAEDSTLVLCEASYRDGRWSFSPLSSIEDARRVMDGDLARAEEDARESGGCHCGGTPACNVCQGRG